MWAVFSARNETNVIKQRKVVLGRMRFRLNAFEDKPLNYQENFSLNLLFSIVAESALLESKH